MRVRLPIWRRGCGIRSRLSLAPAAFCSSFRTSCERLLDTRMADGVTRPGFFPQLEHCLGARSFDFDTPDLRMSTLLASDSHLGHAFSDAWASFSQGGGSTRRQLPRSMHGQRPGTDGRGPPSQSEHRRQSISLPRSLRFVRTWLGLRQHRLRGVQGGRRPPCSCCVVVSPASVALAWRPLHARRAILHDLDAALPGRLRRSRCACPAPPLTSRAHRGLWPHPCGTWPPSPPA